MPRAAAVSAGAERPEVSIVYRHIPQYRREFYERLRADLDRLAIELRLVHGQPVGEDAVKADSIRLPWATEVRNRTFDLAGKQLVWQPAWQQVRRSQLIIVEQASKLPLNYLLLAAQRIGGPRVALWGHGTNMQADGRLVTRAAESVKERSTRAAHWFFAYTDGVAAKVRDIGFPADHITVLQNALDTETLRRWYLDATDAEVDELRAEYGIAGSHVGLYLGALYRGKRLDFLVESALRTRELVGDFELIIAGTGPEAGSVAEAARRHPWIHAVGPVFDRRKALLGRLSDVMLMPDLVGLAILDAFALETPMVTTAAAYDHSPEIEYLTDGVNGMVVPADASARAFGSAVADLLGRPAQLDALRTGCRDSTGRYTVAEMSTRCARGIEAALRAARGAG
jgi:glycosyltransferase involved in cell wall biosynthesis